MINERQNREIARTVLSAGKKLLMARPEQNEIHHKKGPANFVTDYDLSIQRDLISSLSHLLPEASFYGEERTGGSQDRLGEGATFLIDPIDGTTNFMFDYQNSCISVGLADEGRMAAGWVYNPYSDRLYSAVKGQGARLNGQLLTVHDRPLGEGIAAFGCARYNDRETDLMFDLLKALFLSSLSIRNGGSAAIDLCRIASGSNVAYLELLLSPYDYAAASLILEEAGGVIVQTDGSPINLDAPCPILAGTRTAVSEILSLIRDRLSLSGADPAP